MSRKGQHFLVDSNIIERIADWAELSSVDRVLEIGPGTGALTEALSKRAGHVVAIEVDPSLALALKGRFPNVSVQRANALKAPFPPFNKVVSNLPYQISTSITLRLMRTPFDLAVLMYQKEFAERLFARPHHEGYGRLSALAGYFFEGTIIEKVQRSAFRPMPQVDSVVVRLSPRQGREAEDENHFVEMVGALFNQRRKSIRRSLASHIPGAALARLDGPLLDRRPEELGARELAELSNSILRAGGRGGSLIQPIGRQSQI